MAKIIELKDKSNTMPVTVEDCLKDCLSEVENLESVYILKVFKDDSDGFAQGTVRKQGLLTYAEILWMLERHKIMMITGKVI